ncbi:MAG: ATP-binding protein [Planctomycetes bacterium]|nr:ATP-binding protein [Planctomycetota bacterium]
MTPDICYYKTRSGAEVDFIARLPNRSRLLVQACESLAEPATRKREVLALREAMAELRLRSGTIVTRGHEERIEVEGKKITVLPAWRFLLGVSRE